MDGQETTVKRRFALTEPAAPTMVTARKQCTTSLVSVMPGIQDPVVKLQSVLWYVLLALFLSHLLSNTRTHIRACTY